ncbi:MAG: ATP-dependent RNA helicase RhlB [Parasphingorhabdus sp.]|jgi:ATP-dependent RNA helicase RhlB
MNNSHLSEIEFSSLDLHETLKQGLVDAGFSHCTPIQSLTLPVALQCKDVAGQAQTGTGKTAAFLLATVNRLLHQDPTEIELAGTAPRAIILAPTRELAIQIHKDALLLGKHTGLKFTIAYGGTGYEQQREEISRGVDVLIGTPGRLIDYYKQNVYTLDHIRVVVLDEADRMFDLGFIKDMRYILRRMPEPKMRLNMLFSATLSQRVMELAYEHMNEPKTLVVASDSGIADGITESVYYPANDEKIPLILGLLREHEAERSLIFSNTRHGADRVGRYLEANGYKVAVLTGDVPQRKRESLLKAFSNGERNILVATDVAARGLHIPDVSHVFNYDLPQDPEDYVHRIGRTARAGAKGAAISLACEDHAFNLMDIETFIGHALPKIDINPELLPVVRRPAYQKSDSSPRKNNKSSSSNTQNRRPPRTEKPAQKMVETPAQETSTQEVSVQENPNLDTKNLDQAVNVTSPNHDPKPIFETQPEQMPEQQPSAKFEPDNDQPDASIPVSLLSRKSRWANLNLEIPAIG